MAGKKVPLTLLDPVFSVCRLAANERLPKWARGGSFSSVTRTPQELSVVCEQASVPTGVEAESGWRCLMVQGPLEFGEVGILASLTAPLAASQVSVFAISSYDTDFLLIKEASLETAISSLREQGFRIGPEHS